jgi:hypothetical protein
MTTSTAPTVEQRQVLGALARIHARRYARHPVFLVAVVLVLSGLVQAVLAPDGDNGGEWDSALTFVIWIGLSGVIVGYRLTVTEDTALDLLPSAPTSQPVRTQALFLACLVPVVATVVLMAMYGVANLAVPESAAAPFHLRPDTGEIGWPDYLAGVLEAPVSAFGGAALGVVVARWARFTGAGVLTVVVLFLVEIISLGAGEGAAGDALWARLLVNLMPYRYWAFQGAGDGVYTTMAPGSAVGHLVYAIALCGLAVTAGTLKGATGALRASWIRTGVVLIAIAAASYLWAVFG